MEIIAKDKLESYSAKMDEDLIDKIRSILSRRPCTLEDLDLILKIHVNELSKLLRQLIIDKQVSARELVVECFIHGIMTNNIAIITAGGSGTRLWEM